MTYSHKSHPHLTISHPKTLLKEDNDAGGENIKGQESFI